MKLLYIFLLLLPVDINAQKKHIGIYKNHFGSTIAIKLDSTFFYKVVIDMNFSWTKGAWFRIGNSIFFQMVPIWDTVSIERKSLKFDTLILSLDSIASREVKSVYFDTLRSYGQNYYAYPKRLIYRGGRLYQLTNGGKLDKRKVRGLWSRERYPTWYKRVKV